MPTFVEELQAATAAAEEKKAQERAAEAERQRQQNIAGIVYDLKVECRSAAGEGNRRAEFYGFSRHVFIGIEPSFRIAVDPFRRPPRPRVTPGSVIEEAITKFEQETGMKTRLEWVRPRPAVSFGPGSDEPEPDPGLVAAIVTEW